MNRRSVNRFMPLIMAVCVVIGIIVGSFYANHFAGNRLSIINSGSNKINNLLHIINDKYVDTVDIRDLVEKAMPRIITELDPHSIYISAKEAQNANDELKSSFSGVGIEFTIRNDTIRVQNVISGGPAERAGIVGGDKIVSIDGEPFVGEIVTNQEAQSRLKGPKDTKVVIGILSYGEKEPKEITVIRGDIPQHSITASYIIAPKTGYVKVKNFAENTYSELLINLVRLSQQGMENLIIDLRGNTGGFLGSAVQMANEFLDKGKMIVYMEGAKSKREEYESDGRGSFRRIPLVVLIDETSASASEIFAGAMQDNDRATIIGRRSFGKGLVQEPLAFTDGSMIRLTIARYYTPSGRCIQKPYSLGDDKSYDEDLISRYEHGEYFSEDSIKHSGEEYHTLLLGRTVYGGGGITPDIFVAEDTLGMTSYYKEASLTGLLMQFAFVYSDENRETLAKFTTMSSLAAHLKKQGLVEQFAAFAEKNGLKRRNLMIRKSYKLLERYINCRIIYNVMREQEFTEYLNQDDPVIEKALDIIEKGEAFPSKKESDVQSDHVEEGGNLN